MEDPSQAKTPAVDIGNDINPVPKVEEIDGVMCSVIYRMNGRVFSSTPIPVVAAAPPVAAADSGKTGKDKTAAIPSPVAKDAGESR